MQFLNVFNDFKQLCCNQQTQCAVASRVYMDLILDKKYCCTNKCYDTSLEVFYLKAETVDKKKFLILPCLVTKDLDLNTIHKLRSVENGIFFWHYVTHLPTFYTTDNTKNNGKIEKKKATFQLVK